MNVYGQAMSSSKREANSKIVEMVLNRESERLNPRICDWSQWE